MKENPIKTPWLKWYWRYHALYVDSFKTLSEAIESSWYNTEWGEEAFGWIEGPNGVVSGDIISIEFERLDDEEKTEIETTPVFTHIVYLKSPDGNQDAPFAWCESQEEAVDQAAVLKRFYGCRVYIKPI